MTKKGQSAVELAIFGSIFLFCLGALITYGMSYNFQQQHQMNTFAITLADAWSVKDTSLVAQRVILRDKHIPDPQNAFGIGGFQPVIASYSATLSNELDSEPAYGSYEDLPKVTFDVNGRIGTNTTAGWNYDHPTPLNKEIVRKVSDLLDKFRIDDSDDWYPESPPNADGEGDGIYYRYIKINIDVGGGRCVNDGGQLCNCDGTVFKYDLDGDGVVGEDEALLSDGMSVYFDFDEATRRGHEEMIAQLMHGVEMGDGYWKISNICTVDPSRGEIDLGLDPEKVDPNFRPGISPMNHKDITTNNVLTTSSDGANYTSTSQIDYKENIQRTLNKKYPPGEDTDEDYTTEREIQRTTTWSVPQ
jgi:hypothetical protein